jgi:hypothetical protein
MNVVETPQTRCRAAISRCDITPPVGIYHRMWGAAAHDRATGIHRPLLATLLALEPISGDRSQVLVIAALDHCILDGPDVEQMQQSVAQAVEIAPEHVLITLSHTHAAGLMSRSRAALPGGEMIGPYLDGIAERLATLATDASSRLQPATIVYGHGRCSLAANRDYFDTDRHQFVCGLNPSGPADDAVLVAKIVSDGGDTIASVVNYACHATTLAWQNTLISPDFIGAMRDTVEQHIGAPCLFLQGASADLGPREGFVGDPAAADRNGRQLAYAALAALESLPPPGTRFIYSGPVVSGATIGTWRHEPLDAAAQQRSAAWKVNSWRENLPYRPDLPSVADVKADLNRWQSDHAAESRARAERAARLLWRLESLPPDSYPLPITLARFGDAFWLFVSGEHYQSLQRALRDHFPKLPIIVATLTGGWQPGYIPPAHTYGRGIYQEQIAVVAAGAAEQIQTSIAERVQQLIGKVTSSPAAAGPGKSA